ncbi:molybdenum cofactor guanylyltransferase [Leptothoe sp. PORK10 BA2]|uniref:molybdenum cofactor guanylyltransferase n=1 Tax=Leptothoe sp. PORK10 BA2 TaxID=3110254 RepID=UPI002B1F32C6|nr:molybdenum cofactor guanylyltransferase [Leptothoe sp. PORK10 BA2]MEA5463676.1 molybdenum cofactor guanylyltransferase [Leptothoe sp. PORK10 BA2]
MMSRTAALVLAGGQSRRMGQDKALLSWPTEPQATPVPSATPTAATTLLHQVCTVAQACSSVTYVLTPWPERYGHLLSDAIRLLPEPTVGNGPLGALAQGWSMILQDDRQPGPDWLLVLACDMPALDVPTLQRWQQSLVDMAGSSEMAGARENERPIASLPRHNQRWEPLCGFYHRRCIPSLENALANNVRSFQRWLTDENERVTPLSVENSHILQNCNTPGQWQQFLDRLGDRNPYPA